MKKFIYIFILLLCIIPLGGCFEKDELKASKITTTVYPIEYIVNRLYTNENVVSIYPNGTDINNYKLNKKQIKEYSKTTNLFIYNGLTNEKDIAKELINKNKKIQIIDVAFGLKYSHSIEELWLNPSNYLMLSNTVKNDLIEISNNKYTANKIEENYRSLEEDLSILDANIKSIADNATEAKKVLIISDDAFAFLEGYGFEIINLSDPVNITNKIKEKFKNKTYNKIYAKANEPLQDDIKDLVDNYEAKIIYIDTMTTLTEEERNNNENYLTIMNKFISDLSNNILS